MTQTDSTVLTMLPPDADESLQLAWAIAAAADERKAENIVLLKVAEVSYLADYFVLCTGFSRVQVRAISDSIEALVKEQLGRSPLRTEGRGENSWILQDYGEVIAHSLLPTEREFYNLEAFWGHAERIEFQAPPSL